MQSMNPAGRPKKQLDWEVVDNLLKLGMSGVKIASYFALHEDTLYDRCLKEKGISFTEYSGERYVKGEEPLLKKQYEKALAGDNQMLIHLGKCRLKQYAYEPESAQQDKALIKALLEHIQNQTRNPLKDSDDADAKPA